MKSIIDLDYWGGVVKNHSHYFTNIEEDGLHVINLENNKRIFCYIKNFLKSKNTKKIVISFNGAVSNRKNKKGPFFSFLGVAENLDIPVLSFSDPSTLDNENLELGWYAGNENFINLAKVIGEIINELCFKYNLRPILVGGSGGGFAVLNVSRYLKVDSDLFVWNPQTNITKYIKKHVVNYYNCAFPNVLNKEFENREREIGNKINHLDVLFDRAELSQNLLYLQNKTDSHIDLHAEPFLKVNNFQLISENIYNRKNMFLLSPIWGEGHIRPPVKIIEYIINELFKDNNLSNIVYNLPIIFDDIDF